MKDNLRIDAIASASLISKPSIMEAALLGGTYEVECRDKDSKLKWKDTIKNLVTDVGKNWMLDGILGSAQTNTGPYMGLISSDTWSGVAAGNTMSSHAGWREAGGTYLPGYTTRKTCVWSAASGGTKALSAALSFTFTSGGTVKGCFLVLGTSASNAVDNTGGVLYSCGVFTGGDKTVVSTDVLNVSYTAGLNG
jgi:hypothetical protein